MLERQRRPGPWLLSFGELLTVETQKRAACSFVPSVSGQAGLFDFLQDIIGIPRPISNKHACNSDLHRVTRRTTCVHWEEAFDPVGDLLRPSYQRSSSLPTDRMTTKAENPLVHQRVAGIPNV